MTPRHQLVVGVVPPVPLAHAADVGATLPCPQGRMYEDAPRWGFTFQSYVLLTMMEAHATPQEKPLLVLERSVYSARYCFIENLRKRFVEQSPAAQGKQPSTCAFVSLFASVSPIGHTRRPTCSHCHRGRAPRP